MKTYSFKKVIFRAWLLMSLVYGCICPTSIWGQTELITIHTKKGEVDKVYHDEKAHTIDLFFVATSNDKPFWDFDESNLKVFETIGKQKDTLRVIFQGRIKDEDSFETTEVYQVKTRSKTNYHKEERTYEIIWLDRDGDKELATASVSHSWLNIEGGFSLLKEYTFLDIFLLGLLLLSLLLLGLSELMPLYRSWKFKKEYVMPYASIQKEGEVIRHPITGKPLRPNEEVVVMCGRTDCNSPLSVWKKNSYTCRHYPNCKGNVTIGTQQFFTQVGGFKKLNWLWFGTLGGLLAWAITYAVGNTTLADTFLASSLSMGIGLGIGLTFMLTLVDELGRDVSFVRLFLKTILGALSAALLFYIASLNGITSNAIGTAVTWVLFCITLGAILSIQSSISLIRGIISGGIAGIVSGLAYVLAANLFDEAELVKMITFLLLGSILGVGIIQVIKQLDKIELEVLSPSERSGLRFSLDKFLNDGNNVTIGTDMKKTNVRVKWQDDYVLPEHAELSMKNNQVSIKALKGADIWVNGSPISAGVSIDLKGGDAIRLSRSGPTLFKYLQK